jgi:hypothetical protein
LSLLKQEKDHENKTTYKCPIGISNSCYTYSICPGTLWDANKVVLTSEKLDNGVYAFYSSEAKAKESKGLPVATSGGFIVGDKGVLM